MDYGYIVVYWPNGTEYPSCTCDYIFSTEEKAYRFAVIDLPHRLFIDKQAIQNNREDAEKILGISASEITVKDYMNYLRGKSWQIVKKKVV
jgi:hypothetical protein